MIIFRIICNKLYLFFPDRDFIFLFTVETLKRSRINKNLKNVAKSELRPVIQYEMQSIRIAGTIRRGIRSNNRGIRSNSSVEMVNGARG